MTQPSDTYTAFNGMLALASGSLATTAIAAHRALAQDPAAIVTLIAHDTGRTVDLDLRGTEAEVARRHAGPVAASAPASAEATGPRGRGRPRLGVVAREVTLLPEHWQWLAGQPGGASVALRKLVLQAMRDGAGPDALRRARERAYAFMSTMAGLRGSDARPVCRRRRPPGHAHRRLAARRAQARPPPGAAAARRRGRMRLRASGPSQVLRPSCPALHPFPVDEGKERPEVFDAVRSPTAMLPA